MRVEMEYTQPLQPRETPQIDRNRAMRDGTLKDHGNTLDGRILGI